jgi:RHS repeat-associated protein
VVAVTDESGNKVWEGDYAPFGERVGRDEDSGFDLAGLYTGKEYDEDTGLYYFNARWYDSVVGEFISEDQAKDPEYYVD